MRFMLAAQIGLSVAKTPSSWAKLVTKEETKKVSSLDHVIDQLNQRSKSESLPMILAVSGLQQRAPPGFSSSKKGQAVFMFALALVPTIGVGAKPPSTKAGMPTSPPFAQSSGGYSPGLSEECEAQTCQRLHVLSWARAS